MMQMEASKTEAASGDSGSVCGESGEDSPQVSQPNKRKRSQTCEDMPASKAARKGTALQSSQLAPLSLLSAMHAGVVPDLGGILSALLHVYIPPTEEWRFFNDG